MNAPLYGLALMLGIVLAILTLVLVDELGAPF